MFIIKNILTKNTSPVSTTNNENYLETLSRNYNRKLYLETLQLHELKVSSENRKQLHGLNNAIDELMFVVEKCFPVCLSANSGGVLGKLLWVDKLSF